MLGVGITARTYVAVAPIALAANLPLLDMDRCFKTELLDRFRVLRETLLGNGTFAKMLDEGLAGILLELDIIPPGERRNGRKKKQAAWAPRPTNATDTDRAGRAARRAKVRNAATDDAERAARRAKVRSNAATDDAEEGDHDQARGRKRKRVGGEITAPNKRARISGVQVATTEGGLGNQGEHGAEGFRVVTGDQVECEHVSTGEEGTTVGDSAEGCMVVTGDEVESEPMSTGKEITTEGCRVVRGDEVESGGVSTGKEVTMEGCSEVRLTEAGGKPVDAIKRIQMQGGSVEAGGHGAEGCSVLGAFHSTLR